MDPDRQPVQSRLVATLVAVFAATALLVLASPRLEEQGLYYDELHQATAAFAYQGRPSTMFNVVDVFGIPVLNMHYSGAIKTGVYGAYLRLTGAEFSVRSWRWLGLIFAAGGLAAFCVIAGRGVSPLATGLVALLVVTDANVLLSVRHDWGPVALSLALRLLLLAFLLRRGEAGPGPREAAAIGVLLGLIVFEKLSGVVLAVPLAALIFLCGCGPLFARMRAFILGGIVGSLPLIALNAASFLTEGRFVSLANVPGKQPETLQLQIERAVTYVQMGAGAIVQDYILGRQLTWTPVFEGCAVTAAIVATLWAIRGVAQSEGRRGARLILALLATWLVIAMQLPLLPSQTGIHHWVLGTPFQYVALALAVGWLFNRGTALGTPRGRGGIVALLVALVLIGRAPMLVTLERDLASGAASERFSPSLTRLGELAASEPPDAMFVAMSWGVGTQIVSLSSNKADVVEAFWAHGPDNRLPRLLELHPDKRVFYLVALESLEDVPNRQKDIEYDFGSSDDVIEAPLPDSFRNLSGMSVRRYERR